jgi:formate dehydrogenase major subunit
VGARVASARRPGNHSCLAVRGFERVDVSSWLRSWPVYRQLTGPDKLGRGAATQSARSKGLAPRTASADRVATSVCPYCAVGCAQQVFVRDEKVVQIEGDPRSPISRGRLCPKGSASAQLVTGPQREQKVRYRARGAAEWTDLDLHTAMEMVADRVLAARAKCWQDTDAKGRVLRRTTGFAALGGATLDNEENYLIKKLFTALGAIQIENQARI